MSYRGPKRRARYEQRNTMYIDADVLEEIRRLSIEQDRSISKIVQMCVTLALPSIRKLPSVEKKP